MSQRADIVIVGGGPVGLGLAIDLALRGITTIVLERNKEIHTVPKGQNLTQRTGEHFLAWGVSSAVRAASPIPPGFGNSGIVIYKNLLGDYHYDWFQRSRVRAYYFADNERLPQYNLERVLRDRACELPEVTLIEGADVVDVSQDADGTSVIYKTDGGGSARASAKFAVGCDGARSLTRACAGIQNEVDHEGPRMALLVFRSAALHELLEKYPGKSIFNVMNPQMQGYWQFLGRVDLNGGWFFHCPLPSGATIENFDFRRLLHEFAGAEFDLEFEHIGFWDLRINHARTYRSGRVFIAGDACHSHPPYGGYGINTGFEDIRNLSWKLWAELNGWAGKHLLDSYSGERHPVFQSVSRDFVSRMIDDFRAFTAKYSPVENRKAFEDAWQARANADDSDVTEFLPHYSGSQIIVSREAGISGAVGTHRFTARPGYHLAPQALSGGANVWDVLSQGFTLLVFTPDDDVSQDFQKAAATWGVPMKTCHLPDLELGRIYECEAMMIRPDQFIAWVGHREPVDAYAVMARAIGAAKEGTNHGG